MDYKTQKNRLQNTKELTSNTQSKKHKKQKNRLQKTKTALYHIFDTEP